MLNRTLLTAAAAALVCAGAVSACDKDKKIKTVAEKTTTSCCKATLAKKVDAVMKDMPSMTYKVGDYTTCCPDAAKAKAGKSPTMNGKLPELPPDAQNTSQ